MPFNVLRNEFLNSSLFTDVWQKCAPCFQSCSLGFFTLNLSLKDRFLLFFPAFGPFCTKRFIAILKRFY